MTLLAEGLLLLRGLGASGPRCATFLRGEDKVRTARANVQRGKDTYLEVRGCFLSSLRCFLSANEGLE